jgi:glycosyltransferase involved in cell wall biosynthesis
MSSGPGVLAVTLVVRDEEDILAANLDYHLAQGVDVILAVDHGSRDGTGDILESYARTGRVRSIRDDARLHDQPRRVNRLLRMAAEEHGADWVIHCDADEFWIPTLGSLRDVFAAIPERYGYVRVGRSNFLPTPDDGEPFHQRMTVRRQRSLNLRGTLLEPKVAQRPSAASGVGHGNHDLVAPVLDAAPDIGALEVFHFPLRTFEQFERKVVKTGVGYEHLRDRPPDVGCDQLELLAMHRRGGLRDYYDRESLDAERIGRGVQLGELVVDRRLKTFLERSQTSVAESAVAKEVLRRMWTLAGFSADAAHAKLTQTVHERDAMIGNLGAELEQARAYAEHLRRMLVVLRGSRIMRYSAPARRIYYRLRSTAQKQAPASHPQLGALRRR